MDARAIVLFVDGSRTGTDPRHAGRLCQFVTALRMLGQLYVLVLQVSALRLTA